MIMFLNFKYASLIYLVPKYLDFYTHFKNSPQLIRDVISQLKLIWLAVNQLTY